MKLKPFLTQAASVLRRLDQILPPEQREPDWQAIAFRWQKHGNGGLLTALPRPHTFPLARLCAISPQTQRLVRNTEQFLAGRPANNALLTGARGTGKSSLIKALLHEYAERGLRLIEVDKHDLAGLPLDDTTRRAALQWAQMRGSRSGRTAYQFACDWTGRLPHEREVD